jgi:hypothetical protein
MSPAIGNPGSFFAAVNMPSVHPVLLPGARATGHGASLNVIFSKGDPPSIRYRVMRAPDLLDTETVSLEEADAAATKSAKAEVTNAGLRLRRAA